MIGYLKYNASIFSNPATKIKGATIDDVVCQVRQSFAKEANLVFCKAQPSSGYTTAFTITFPKNTTAIARLDITQIKEATRLSKGEK